MAMARTLLLVLVAAALLPACGDDDGTAPDDGGEIPVEAESDADRKIGEDLVAYLDRNLEGTPEERGSFERACEEPESPKIAAQCDQARAVLDAFGSIDTVEVADGAITIDTGIEPGDDAAPVAGQGLCDLIQGADVADFTAGHRVLGAGDAEIVACEPR